MVIFLDIDGVLNQKKDWQTGFKIRKEAVSSLQELAKKMSCQEIVLSSTWRNIQDFLKPDFENFGLHIVGSTPPSSSKHTRKDEILYYVRHHDCGKYLILDDDESLFGQHSDIPLYVTDCKYGLTKQDVTHAYNFWKKYWG